MRMDAGVSRSYSKGSGKWGSLQLKTSMFSGHLVSRVVKAGTVAGR